MAVRGHAIAGGRLALSIRRLHPPDAAAYQALRLHALRESPTAFGSSYEEEADCPMGAVAGSLAEGSGRSMFGGFIEGELVGAVCIGREPRLKQRHRGFVRSVYVRPEARGQGAGRALMAVALQHALTLPVLRQITLSVTAGNAAALATYAAFGFLVCGTVPQALRVEGCYYDELQMVCDLGALRSVAPAG